MKRQKRRTSVRAYSKGYESGLSGRSKSGCPHESGVNRDQWMVGWREGREDHWNGFSGAAGAQKLVNM